MAGGCQDRGPGQNCQVYLNDITHTNRYAYAGLMVGFGGDHTGSNVYENTVASASNLVSVGLMVGDHPWGTIWNVSHAGTVSGNTIDGAVTLMWVEGVWLGTVTGNTLQNRQGTNALFGCGYTPPFAKGHFYLTTLQDDGDWIEFDNGVCTSVDP